MKKMLIGFITVLMMSLSGVVYAEIPDCKKNRSPSDVEQCKEARLRMLID